MGLSPYREPSTIDPRPPLRIQGALGALRTRYRPRRLSTQVVATVLLAVAFAALLLTSRGADFAASKLPAAAVLVGIAAAVALLRLLELWLTRQHGEVDLHAGGVVVRRAKQRREILFEEVDQLYLVFDPQIRAVELVGHDRERVIVPTTFENSLSLIDALHRACSIPLLGEAERALREGASLDFGIAQLTANEMVAEQQLSWSEVLGLRLQRNTLVLIGRKRRTTRVIPLAKVPHPWIFVHLVQNQVTAKGALQPSRSLSSAGEQCKR